MSWHADDTVLATYRAQRLDGPRAYSLEAHLLACESCRARLAAGADTAPLERMWENISETLDVPRPGIVERALLMLGVREHVARLLAATASLRLSWLLAEALVLFLAVFLVSAGRGSTHADATLFAYLMLAALLPVAGIGVAYGPGVDPTHEIGLAAPMRTFRLLLIRACAVLGASVMIASVTVVALPSLDWTAVAWVVPSLALTLATLALSTAIRPARAAVVVTATWLAIASTVAYRGSDTLATFRASGQLLLLGVIATSIVVLAQHPHLSDGRIER
jgi:hypothetical protein